MVKCSFSGKEILKGTGITYVKKDGTVMYFFSSKERKNYLGLGREGRLQKWTPSGQIFRKQLQQATKQASKAKTQSAPAIDK